MPALADFRNSRRSTPEPDVLSLLIVVPPPAFQPLSNAAVIISSIFASIPDAARDLGAGPDDPPRRGKLRGF
jgi:hypothetical protein